MVSGVRCQVEFRRVRSRVGHDSTELVAGRADHSPGFRKPEIGGHPAYSGTLLARTMQIT
jgi:hypothetical protein